MTGKNVATQVQRVLLSAAIVMAASASSPSWSAGAMPNAFTVTCDGGHFGHGADEAQARASLASSPPRSDSYSETFAFDLSKLTARMTWARSKREAEWTLTRSGATSLLFYTYREGGFSRWRHFDFAAMENVAVAIFPSLAPDYRWTISVQKCRQIN